MAWGPDYVTASEMKSYLRIDDTVDDTEIGFAITAASRAIDKATNRQFGVVGSPEVRRYYSRWDRRRCVYVVEIDDLMTTTGLVVTNANGDTVSELVTAGDSGFTLEPVNNADMGRPWTQFVVDSATGYFDVTGSWGWTAVPDTIKQAALLQASRLFKRRDAPFGVAGSPDLGSELRLLAKVDADVEVVVAAYRRWWGAA